jgi:cell division protein FtsW (lipid II flippase)
MAILFGAGNMGWLRRYKYTWAVIGVILVGITLVNALRVKNLDAPTHDQLNFGPLSLQPSELLKIIIVVFFAAYLSENRDMIAEGSFKLGPIHLPPLRQLGPLGLMLGIALLLFLGVRELGLALLIYGIFLSMLYLGSGKISFVLGGLIIFFVLGFIGYSLFSYVRNRFTTVGLDMVNWSSWSTETVSYAQNAGAQVAQGIIAISSGGILGAGFGLGHASGLVFVAQSDMVVSVLGEEFGLVGLFAMIGFYLILLYRGFKIAIEARESFDQLLAAGLTSIFGIQTLIICSGNLKLLPLTGIPLPFLSYGGSSVIANFLIIGILLRISYNTAREKEGLA